jgi:glutathione S-transferase
MMQIYGRRSSINVQKVTWCLAELGLVEGRDYHRIDAGLEFGVNNTPEYLKLNPNGLVPTLVDGDFVLWESNSIVRYLAAVHGDGTLLPTQPAARADSERWMDWQLGTLWAALRITFLGLTRTPEPQRNYEAIKKAYHDSSRMLVWVDSMLAGQPFLTGASFTVADLAVAVAVHRWMWLPEKFPEVLGERPALPSLLAWYRKIAERPAFQSAVV